MSQLLSNECSQTPVTALAIHKGLLLSGQGPFIRIHHQSTNRLLAITQALNGQAVHGIRIVHFGPSTFSVIVWGGRLLKGISISKRIDPDDSTNFHVFLRKGTTIEIEDWILDVAPKALGTIHPSQEPVCATLLTAHNAVYSVDWQESSSDLEESIQLSVLLLVAGRKCILYSAHLKWISTTEILIASGTAFGEIIVWSCSLSGENASIRTYFSFMGHEGSIFGVQISEPIEFHSKTARRLLTSCSDDRTIRVWDISNLEMKCASSQSSENTANQDTVTQETGFPTNLSDQRDNNCLAVAIGHVSRIWDIRYLYARANESDDSIVTIISVGEDGTCQSWALRHEVKLNSGEPTFSLSHLFDSAHHSGKNIWSVATNEQVEAPGISVLFTGGADGRIISRNLVSPKTDIKLLEERDITTVLQTMFSLPATKPINSIISRKASKATADYFRSYAYVTKHEFLVTTNNGLVLLETDEMHEIGDVVRRWHQVDLLDELKGYSVVSSIPDSGLAFLGGATGSLFCFDSFNKKTAFLAKTDGKIAGIFPYHIEPRRIDIVDVLLTYLGTYKPRLLRLQRSLTGWMVRSNDDLTIQSVQQGVQFTQSSSALVSSIDGQITAFLGHRDGSLHLLNRRHDGSIERTIASNAHGKEAVTAMQWVSSTSSNDPSALQVSGWLFSVGRDGTCAVHSLRRDSKEFTLVHKLALPFGPNIEGVHVSLSADDVYVYGFHGKQFVVYNISASDYILNIDCGGAHRMWHFDPRYDPTGKIVGGNLAWTKASKLNSYNVLGPSHEIVQDGGHGREIKTCAINTASTKSLGPLIATGAEDTDICLFQFRDLKFSCVAILRKHVTGIQSLQWSKSGEYLFSCGGYEEFFIWRVRSVPAIKVGVVFESSCPIESERSDLRIMGFAIKEKRWTEQQQEASIEDTEFEITMLYSNSEIKTWRYDAGRKLWTILSIGRYTSACPTQISYLDQGDRSVIMTTATDGHVAFWKDAPTDTKSLSNELTCLATRSLHQSAIKSLSCCSLRNDTTLIVTGGDDNGLGLSLISISESHESQCRRLLIPRAHAAAVTATAIVMCTPSDTNPCSFQVLVATASNDQRIKMWRVDIDLGQEGLEVVDVKMVANGYTSVADVSSMALYPADALKPCTTRILVCGVGMEIWTVDA